MTLGAIKCRRIVAEFLIGWYFGSYVIVSCITI